MLHTEVIVLGLLAFFNTTLVILAVVLILHAREYTKTSSPFDIDAFHSVIFTSIEQQVCFISIIGILLGIAFGLCIVPENYFELIGTIPIVIGIYKLVEILTIGGYLEFYRCRYFPIVESACESESENSPLCKKQKDFDRNDFITKDYERKYSFVEIDLEADIGTEEDEYYFQGIDSLSKFKKIDYCESYLENFSKMVKDLVNPLILEVIYLSVCMSMHVYTDSYIYLYILMYALRCLIVCIFLQIQSHVYREPSIFK
jgi:hypothetical protein